MPVSVPARKVHLGNKKVHFMVKKAEIELSAMQRGCLNRRLARAELDVEVPAWMEARNALSGKVSWQFRSADARLKLRRLYPVLKASESTA